MAEKQGSRSGKIPGQRVVETEQPFYQRNEIHIPAKVANGLGFQIQ